MTYEGERVLDLSKQQSQDEELSSEVQIFYSWQSDLDSKNNHYFIRDALEVARKRCKKTTNLDLRLDSDTQGVSGSPDIAEVIWNKIDHCDIFVADISIINPDAQHRKTPNPNVLLELGYAVKRLGWEKIICVFNCISGKVEDLPFDLRGKRVTKYTFPDGNKAKSECKKQLEDVLYTAIVAAIETINHERETQQASVASKKIPELELFVTEWTLNPTNSKKGYFGICLKNLSSRTISDIRIKANISPTSFGLAKADVGGGWFNPDIHNVDAKLEFPLHPGEKRLIARVTNMESDFRTESVSVAIEIYAQDCQPISKSYHLSVS